MNSLSEVSTGLESLMDVTSILFPMIGIILFIAGGMKLFSSVTRGHGFGEAPIFLFAGIMMLTADPMMKSIIGSDDFEKKSVFYTESSKPEKTVPNVIGSKPQLEKKEPIKRQESKPVDYMPFLKIIGSLFAGIICFVVGFFTVDWIISVLKFRKVKKSVVHLTALPNDFMVLSSEIEKIEDCIEKIKRMLPNYSGKRKNELKNFSDLLINKKSIFTGMIQNINESVPELKDIAVA